MKLSKFKIQEYKNFKNFEIDFKNHDNLVVIVGLNGSGKSNLLEAVSSIYKRIANDEIIDEYVYFKVNEEEKLIKEISKKEYENANIIALYSGEEDRLWKKFYEEEYLEKISNIREGNQVKKTKLIYINKYYWNISLLTLLIDNLNTEMHLDFLEKDLKLKDINEVKIVIEYDLEKFKNAKGSTKAYFESLNKDGVVKKEYTLFELKEIFAMSNALQIFTILESLNIPKDYKLIKNIEIKLFDKISVKSLSEGEKKLILLKVIFDVLSNENSVILLDEPDAHIHEDRKKYIYDFIKKYNNRNIILTTHSPSLTACCSEKNLVILDGYKGEKIDINKVDIVKNLFGNTLDPLEKNILLSKELPIILFEGPSDVKFVKRAIEYFIQKDSEKYGKLKNVRITSTGGSGTAKYKIEEILKTGLNNTVIMIFDKDKAGEAGKKSILTYLKIKEIEEKIKLYDETKEKIKTLEKEEVVKFLEELFPEGKDDFNKLKALERDKASAVENVLKEKKIYIEMLPSKNDEIKEQLIEDYFSNDLIKEQLTKKYKEFLEKTIYRIKEIPDFKEKIKSEIFQECDNYPLEYFHGFEKLIDLILQYL